MQFDNLIGGLGPGCKNPLMYPDFRRARTDARARAAARSARDPPITRGATARYWYCLGCDPDQPLYTDGEDIRVCKSFVDRFWANPTIVVRDAH